MFRPELSLRPVRVVAMHAGSVRDSSSRLLAERCLGAVRSIVDIEGQVVGMADHVHSICQALASGGSECQPDIGLSSVRDEIAAADAVIAVTPIVHGSYSGLFKAFVDVMGTKALGGKPILIGASGGTRRHCLALEHVVRPLFVCLRGVVVPTSVFATRTECGAGRVSSDVQARIRRAGRELASLITASSRSQVMPGA